MLQFTISISDLIDMYEYYFNKLYKVNEQGNRMKKGIKLDAQTEAIYSLLVGVCDPTDPDGGMLIVVNKSEFNGKCAILFTLPNVDHNDNDNYFLSFWDVDDLTMFRNKKFELNKLFKNEEYKTDSKYKHLDCSWFSPEQSRLLMAAYYEVFNCDVPNKCTDEQVKLLAPVYTNVFQEFVGGVAVKTAIKVHVLGRERLIYKQGRKSYVTYKKQLIPLADARKLEKSIYK